MAAFDDDALTVDRHRSGPASTNTRSRARNPLVWSRESSLHCQVQAHNIDARGSFGGGTLNGDVKETIEAKGNCQDQCHDSDHKRVRARGSLSAGQFRTPVTRMPVDTLWPFIDK
jgi:hypothetical protein